MNIAIIATIRCNLHAAACATVLPMGRRRRTCHDTR